MLTPEQENVLMGYMGIVLFIGFVMLVAALWRGPGCSGSCKQGRGQCDCEEGRDA